MLIVPRYLQEIAKPRDFGTIMKKIEGKEGRKYQTMQQLGEDIELVFNKYVTPCLLSVSVLHCTDTNSCRQFNGPGEISALADKTEAVYRREWPKAVDSRMTPEEKRAMNTLLARAIKEPMAHIFKEPVDPVALNIPSYFEV